MRASQMMIHSEPSAISDKNHQQAQRLGMVSKQTAEYLP